MFETARRGMRQAGAHPSPRRGLASITMGYRNLCMRGMRNTQAVHKSAAANPARARQRSIHPRTLPTALLGRVSAWLRESGDHGAG